MTVDELRTALREAPGAPADRPPLDGVWTTGRARRRRTRVLGAAAAVVAVVVLAAGALALTAGGGDEDVVAGPGGGGAEEAPPPPESPSDAATLTVATMGEEDGVPVTLAGANIAVTMDAPPGIDRTETFRWEAWDGESWRVEHELVPGGRHGPAEVLDPLGPDEWMAQAPMEGGIGPLLVPEADPGWYRVCNEVVGTVVVPEETDPVPVREPVCDQLRVVAEAPEDVVATTTVPVTTVPVTTAPPPAEPELPVALDVGSELPAGGLVFADLTWVDGASGLRLAAGIWQAWDGETWTTTHQTSIVDVDTTPETPEIRPIAEAIGVDTVGIPAAGRVAFLVPPPDQAPPGPYRLCLDVEVQTPAPDSVTLCEQVTVTLPDLVPGYPDRDAATWALDPDDPPDPADEVVTVLVTRAECTDGAAGPLLEPEVEDMGDAVRIRISAGPGDGPCPTDEPVPVEVALGAPLGERSLVDGACMDDSYGLVEACEGGWSRWPRR
jgi:hypothetical protein